MRVIFTTPLVAVVPVVTQCAAVSTQRGWIKVPWHERLPATRTTQGCGKSRPVGPPVRLDGPWWPGVLGAVAGGVLALGATCSLSRHADNSTMQSAAARRGPARIFVGTILSAMRALQQRASGTAHPFERCHVVRNGHRSDERKGEFRSHASFWYHAPLLAAHAHHRAGPASVLADTSAGHAATVSYTHLRA